MAIEFESGAEPAHDILGRRRQPLEVFFRPQNVAVIGATERPGSAGRTVLTNLIANPFGGTVAPVNPKRSTVLDIKAYANIKAVPGPVDLAVIVTPAATVPQIIGECVEAGVKGAIIISAGFKESLPAGAALERQIRERLRGSQMRVLGPNCLGVMSPRTGINATIAAGMGRPGSVGFVSQSGALLTAILDWSLRENVGFSAFVSVGSMLDVGWGDMIGYLADDPHTFSVVLYMESIGDARYFLSAAREVALRKPLIVIKAGRTEAAARAAASHTGSLTGSDEVLNAAFRRCGVLRVDSIADLFYMADVFSKQPRARGPHLTIVTNAGGPGVLATDALIANGGQLAPLSGGTLAALNDLLPPQWSHHNPLDILGDAGPERYSQAVEHAAANPYSDGLLVILTPQAMTDPTRTADHLKSFAISTEKPIIASWMGGASVQAGIDILNRANIPTFPYPDTAARAFCYLWHYSYNLAGLYETPALAGEEEAEETDRERAGKIIATVRQAGRTLLTEFESKQILAVYNIPTVETRIATNEEAAIDQANQIGYPVALKLHSETITHKTDVDGVQLNLPDGAAVGRAYQTIEAAVLGKMGPGNFSGVTVQPMVKTEGYELILGCGVDAQFGPVLLFGTGGRLVEVFKDRALALPPLNTTLARRLMEQTRFYAALKEFRGRKPVDLVALEHLLVRFSQLCVEQRWIKEIDINPLLVSPDGLLALDARVVVHGKEVREDQLPHLAIRPYPAQYVTSWKDKVANPIKIRPIRPEDEPLFVRFHETLSEQSVYRRYMQVLKLSQRAAHERLSRICFIDYDREMALVAERKNPRTNTREVIAVGQLIKQHGEPEAEFALLVSDAFQGKGLGTEMLRRLLQVARDEKLCRVTGNLLPDNLAMQRVCEKLGFGLQRSEAERLVKAVVVL